MKISQLVFGFGLFTSFGQTALAAASWQQMTAIHTARLDEQKRLQPQLIQNKDAGNCSADFNALTPARSQVTVYAGHYSALTEQAFSAVYLVTKDGLNRPTIRTIVGSDAPGNNNGSIEWVGTTLIVSTGGVGANCTISITRTF